MNGEYKVILELFGAKALYKLVNSDGEVVGTGPTLEEACLDACVQCWPHKAVVDEVIIK